MKVSDSDSIKTEQIKMLQAGRNVRAIEKQLSKPFLTKREFKGIITRVGWDVDSCNTKLTDIDSEFKVASITTEDLIEKFRKEHEHDPDEKELEDIIKLVEEIRTSRDPNRESFRDEFYNFVITQELHRWKLDPLTSVGAGAPGESAYKAYWVIALGERIFTYWAQPGRLGLIVGETGAGKTDWLMKLCEILRGEGYVIVSNVKLRESVEGYVYCSLLSNIYLEGIKAKRIGKRVLFGFDEAMIHAPSTRTSGTNVRQLENMVALGRKYWMAIIILLQYMRRVPMVFREDCHAFFDIYSFEEMFVDISVKQRPGQAGINWSDFVSHRPQTSLPYDTGALAGFMVDFDVKDALDYIALHEGDSTVDLDKLLEDYLYYIQGKIQMDSMPKDFKKFFAYKMYENKGRKIGLEVIGDTIGVATSTAKSWIDEIAEKIEKSKNLETVPA